MNSVKRKGINYRLKDRLDKMQHEGNGISSLMHGSGQQKRFNPQTNGANAPDGPDIYIGVVYAYKSGSTSSGNDHIWGRGTVVPDPKNSNIFVAIWTKC